MSAPDPAAGSEGERSVGSIAGLIRLAHRSPLAVLVLWLALAFVGVRAFVSLPIEPFPDTDDNHVTVITFYPGKAPEEVETVISRPLEFAINGAPGLLTCRSVSMFGLSYIVTTFDDSTDDYFARHEIFERISGVQLPPGVQPQMQPLTDSCGEVFRYTLEGQGHNLVELKAIQDWVVIPALLAVPGVGDVNPFGGGSKEYICYPDPALLRGYGVTLSQVFQALSNGNSNGGGSVIPKGQQEYTVRAKGLFENPQEAEDVVVASTNGVPIYVHDVAHVEKSTIPRRGFVAKNGRDDVIEGIVLVRRFENPTEVCSRIRKKVDDLNKLLAPKGVRLVAYYDRTYLVWNTLRTLVWNDFHGLLLVFFILALFMGDLRSAFIVCATIPLAVLFAFTMLHVLHQPINLLAFGAVDFGILCDGTVIFIEGMFVFLGVHAARARSSPEAQASERRKGLLGVVLELGPTLFYALLIMIVLQTPILLFERVEGRIFRPQALMTGLSILGALLVSVTLVPHLATVWLRGPGEQGIFGRVCGAVTQPLMHGLRRGYERALGWALVLRWPIIGIAIVGIAMTVRLMIAMGTEFLPRLEEGNIWLKVSQPISVSTEESKRTEHKIRELIAGPLEQIASRAHPDDEDRARRFPEVRLMVTQLGRPEDGTDVKGIENIECHVDLFDHEDWVARDIPKAFLKDPALRAPVCRRSPCPDAAKGLCEHRPFVKDELVEQMNRELQVFPGVQYNFSQYIQDNVEEALSGLHGQVAIKVFGNDLHQLQVIGNRIADVLATVSGATDVGAERLKGMPELVVKINRSLAARAGINVADIQQAIETGVAGAQASTMVEENRFFNIVVRLTKDSRNSPDTIRNIQIPEPDGSLITLGEVADITVEDGAMQIRRERNSRRIGIKCSIRGRDLGSLVREAKEKVQKEVVEKRGADGRLLFWKDGYEITWEGEFESAQRAGERLKIIIPISIVVIYSLLLGAFRSFRTALLIMVTVPLALIGGVLGLYNMGIYLSVAATMGFITLFGTAVQNGMILVARIHTLRDVDKVEFVPAIIRGCGERLRPVLMTGLTAAVGFAPSIVSHGMGAEVRKPLATVVVFGMLTSTFFTLFVLPCLYSIFEEAPVKAPGLTSH